uniref:Uncharacterized protein n=1 Tax=Panagrolaimus sp. JU765 TaxID=591449 RepID=A0AC34RAD1_9BILA
MAEVPSSQIREIQSEIVQMLNENRDLNLVEQDAKVQQLLAKLDDESRIKYELWISELKEIENERSQKLKDLMLRLTPESQQALTRILLVQQSETLTSEQKLKRLDELNKDLPDSVKDEIADQLERHIMLRKFLQSRSY